MAKPKKGDPTKACIWVEKEIIKHAKTIAAIEGVSLGDVVHSELKPAIARRLRKAVNAAASAAEGA
jgi:hypothetical protein